MTIKPFATAVEYTTKRGVKYTRYVIAPREALHAGKNPKRALRPAGMSGRQWVRFRKALRRAA
jgi:hypothetical protein